MIASPLELSLKSNFCVTFADMKEPPFPCMSDRCHNLSTYKLMRKIFLLICSYIADDMLMAPQTESLMSNYVELTTVCS